MNAVYQGEGMLNGIQDKLDRYVLGGMTLTEAYEKNGTVDLTEAQQFHLRITTK